MNNVKPVASYLYPYISKERIYIENKRKSGVYCWRNKITGEIYVGATKNLNNRLSHYYSSIWLKNFLKRSSSGISSSILKYKSSNFSLYILEYCEPKLLREKEQHYINLLKPQHNILKFAGSPLNHILSKKTKLKISLSLKSKFNNNKPKIVTYETKLKLSLNCKGINIKIFDISGNLIK